MACSSCGVIVAVLLVVAIVYEVDGRFSNEGCDLFEGSWVYDNVSYPLYDPKGCPFIEKEFDCQHNGRPDSSYLHFRWQPSACNLPRLEGKRFLERLSGKRIMFVGDSLSLNQWQSLTCMLHRSVPDENYTSTRTGGLSTFTFRSFNVKVMFSRNAFLVDIVSTPEGRVLELDSIESGKTWKDIDVLIFNSWHWWLHIGRKQPWDLIRDENAIFEDMDRLVAYGKALETWANWVDSNVHPAKTTVFFQGISPDHMNGSNWGDPNAENCEGQTRPLQGTTYPGGRHPAELVLEKVIGTMKKPVYLLNITTLSQLRKDGHPSLYGFGGLRAMDCSHWCLAGVPDTWNQLLYTALVQM